MSNLSDQHLEKDNSVFISVDSKDFALFSMGLGGIVGTFVRSQKIRIPIYGKQQSYQKKKRKIMRLKHF